MTKAYAQHGDAAGTFLGHPKGLFVLFFAEMWERFSYYGMRALLIFYLTKHWLFSDGEAGVIYGAYTALVYITPVLGGYLADRWLGQRKAVLYGAVLLTFGHFLMGFEGNGGQDAASLNIFWLALAFIIVGSGFLKANISVIVGQLYPRTDVRRDGAYTIFYMGINLGAALGSLLCGYLGETYGWAYGFGAAGFGMLLGLIVFVLFKPLLLGRGEPEDPAKLAAPVMGIKFEWLLYVVGLLAVGVCWWMVQNQAIVGTLLGVAGAILVGYVIFTAVIKLPAEDRDRIFAALFLILGSILFWALFEQAGSSLNLFTDRYVDRGGVPASVFQSVNAIYIVLLAPLFAALWTWLGRRNMEPSTPVKFGLAMLQLGLGFFVLKWGRRGGGHGQCNARPVHFPDLSVPHDRRALPVAGGPQRDEPARAGAYGVADHGHLVLRIGDRQFRRGPDRGGDRIGEGERRRRGQGAGARRLQHHRFVGGRFRRAGDRRVAADQEADASRYAA